MPLYVRSINLSLSLEDDPAIVEWSAKLEQMALR